MSITDVLERRPGHRAPLVDEDLLPADPAAPADRPPWWRRAWSRFIQPESLITFAVVAVCVGFTFDELHPSLIFANTTPAGGDMGAHVWLPAYIKAHLLPHLRVTGWAPSWYDGFPVLTYYFPLPMWAIAFISYVIPYNIAFKLVTIAGLVTLPICCWAFGRLARMRFPGPACLAVGSVGYLFCRDFTIYGGNIASTMAGEFSFSIALSFAMLFLGVVARGLQNGKHRGIAAVLLFCCALSHILPMFFAVGGAVVLTLMRLDKRRLRWVIPVLVVGGALTAFWSFPFEYRLPYATNMGYQKITTYISSLFPPHDIWLFILATVGIVLSLVRRRRTGTFLGIMLVLCIVVFCGAPNARLWNARVLPFWFLLLYLLAGVALAEVGTLIAEAAVRNPLQARPSLLPIPVLALIIALLWVGFPLRILPFGSTNPSTNKYSWLGITSSDSSFVPDWVKWNYSGYQSSGKTREAEYFALVDEMAKLGKNPADGCGTADWEYEPSLDEMGTPDALMLLPYWTNDCIDSMEGLYYESSATTPYHFLDESELSESPADPMRGLNYGATTMTSANGSTVPNVAAGIAHLQMMGVKYYMALTPETQNQADADPALTLVGEVGPYPDTVTTGSTSTVVQRTWKIYKVADSQIVAPLTEQPVVVKGVSSGGNAWLNASEAWYLNPSESSVFEAASGPKSWPRVEPGAKTLPLVPEPPVTVSKIKETDDTVNFNVDRTGVPVLVKVSYFPNWEVTGAKEIYRVTPNLMVVVPTSKHVRLHYGYTPIDWFGFIVTLLGIAALVALIKLGPVRYPRRRAKTAEVPVESPGLVPASSSGLAEPYQRLGMALADALPGDRRAANGDLDLWLGHPGGLDVARYYATGWQGRPSGEDPDPSIGWTEQPPATQPPAEDATPPAPEAPPGTE